MSEKTLTNEFSAEKPLWDDALTLCRDMQRGDISSEELMSNIYRRIKTINPHVNAIVSLLDEETAMELAVSADQVPISDRGPLHGIPMAPKDAVAVKGFPTTRGFAPFAKYIEKEDELLTSRRAMLALFSSGIPTCLNLALARTLSIPCSVPLGTLTI